jgi:pilus assembly protein Flp/PilA
MPIKVSIPRLRRFARAQAGATAIEYALIASGIAGVLITVILALGGSVTAMYQTIANALG